ncbi:MAG: SDR family oxidoreductase [Pararhodobacter sp.]|nr:SDR family oxidoreductase [Pararhodobacter sp.]
MDLGISGKVVLITGGGGALGTAMASIFAAEGAKIAVVDVNAENAATVAATLTDGGAAACAIGADITDKAQIDQAFSQAEQRLGPIDILVNNAGFSRDSYLTKMDEADWDLVHYTVLKGTFHCCRAALPGMMERRFGRIVNISSMSYLGNAGQTNYSSAKAGLIGMTNALAREAGRFNITVNAIAPGLIVTPRLRARKDFDVLEQRSNATTPMPRLGLPEDCPSSINQPLQ